jgi:hypothetical protein
MSPEMLSITKLEAASRQLEAAIRLHFEDRDPVAIHTLAAAAVQVSVDLTKARKLPALGKFDSMVKPEHKGMVRKTLAEPENFFKHADNDPDATLAFNPEVPEFFMFACITDLQALGLAPTPAMLIFTAWFHLKHPDLLLETEETRPIRAMFAAKRSAGLSPDDRAVFLSLLPS